MRDTLSALVYWKLVIFKVSNGFMLVVAMAFLAATDGIDWDAFTAFQKFKLAVFCTVAGLKYIDGFFDQTLTYMKSAETAKAQAAPPP